MERSAAVLEMASDSAKRWSQHTTVVIPGIDIEVKLLNFIIVHVFMLALCKWNTFLKLWVGKGALCMSGFHQSKQVRWRGICFVCKGKPTVRSVILWLLVRAVMAKPTVFMPAMTSADIARACPAEYSEQNLVPWILDVWSFLLNFPCYSWLIIHTWSYALYAHILHSSFQMLCYFGTLLL